ncbi:RNase LS, toxin [Xylanibacter ruminicola]|uniref:RNase LS, toxin n=1 Tax=Xylanibacter ruminicola TaxID=839 RepID=A0A1M7FTP1_XYLRU|nr:RNase LS family HEPN domain-containing protein [Xylanibacter ruminicola]SFC50975.1 RNase LS, toxin [Xylanibacter ruminicola]SFC61737.1 RNase LS, toxin [Xylanibacter ruminicola]SHM07403.1 RNase LS, toxin [Xylanibacter ruminicola]
MSLKKLHLYRNKIEQAVRDFVGDNTLQIEVQSPQKIKYTVSFADEHMLPAMVFVNYNQDGTTTIEDSRGRNKAYAAKLAEHIANNTKVRLYETGHLYFADITQEQFDLFVELMTSCNATITSVAVVNGDKYSICGEYGDMLYATRFNNGSILFQGHPCITFNNAITILYDIYPSDMILEGLTKYYKLSFEQDDVKKELYSQCPKLNGNLTDDVVKAILPSLALRRSIPDGLTDYSYLCFPVLRGLECIIKTIFKDKGDPIPTTRGFANYMCYDDASRTASVHALRVGLFPDPIEKTRVETLYKLWFEQRHRIFHLDPLMPILLGKEDALDIIEQTLNTINDAY